MGYCPNCGTKQRCPCHSCKNYGEVTWRWNHDGNTVTCGGCGLTASADWWENLDVEICHLLESNKKEYQDARHEKRLPFSDMKPMNKPNVDELLY